MRIRSIARIGGYADAFVSPLTRSGAQNIVLVVPVAVGMDSLLQPLPSYNAATIAASTYQVYAGEKIVMTVPNEWEVAYAFFPISVSGPPAQLTLTTSEGATAAAKASTSAGGAAMTGPAIIEGAHGVSTTTSGGGNGSSAVGNGSPTANNETLAVNESTAVEDETLAGNESSAANDSSMAEGSSSGTTSSPATAGGTATLHHTTYHTTIIGRQPQ